MIGQHRGADSSPTSWVNKLEVAREGPQNGSSRSCWSIVMPQARGQSWNTPETRPHESAGHDQCGITSEQIRQPGAAPGQGSKRAWV